MNHVNLALKYRPSKFEDVVGQEQTVRVLKELALRRHDLRVILMSGQHGIGKTSLSRLYAKLLNCQSPANGDACGECPSCVAMQAEAHPDYQERDMGSSGLVADVREMRQQALMKPTFVCRVFGLDEIHGASKGAFNALLRVLEDPPQSSAFVLLTTELSKVPFTVASRALPLELAALEPSQVKGRILSVAREDGIELAGEAADLIARECGGSMRDALMMLDRLSVEHSGKIELASLQGEAWFVARENAKDLAMSLYRAEREPFNQITSQMSSRLSYETLVREALRLILVSYIKKERKPDNLVDALWTAVRRLKMGVDPELVMDGLWVDGARRQ